MISEQEGRKSEQEQRRKGVGDFIKDDTNKGNKPEGLSFDFLDFPPKGKLRRVC